MEDMIEEIQAYINECDVIVCHNAKFDLSWLSYVGLNTEGKKVWCTQVADYLINGQDTRLKYNLSACSIRHGGEEKLDMMSEYWKRGIETYDIPMSVHEPYLEQDLRVTEHLYLSQLPLVNTLQLNNIVDINMELVKMLSVMESSGVGFDKDGAEKYVAEYAEILKDIDNNIYKLSGLEFNVGSSDQLGAILFGGSIKRDVQEFVCRPRKNGTVRVYTRKAIYDAPVKGMGFKYDDSMVSSKTGKPSTGKNVLARLGARTQKQKDFLKLLVERSGAAKTYSTLVSDKDNDAGLLRKIGTDGRIHPNFNQTTTRTGRLSSSNPNGQNLPRSGTSPLKKLFKARDGYVMINGDLSQIEWRTDAGMSRDPVMIQEIVDGVDIHTYAGVEFFGGNTDDPKFKSEYRQPAKVFNFRMIYDGKARSFYSDYNMPSFTLKKWEGIVKAFWSKYNVLRSWILNNEMIVKQTKGWLRQPSGRLLNFIFHTEESHEYKRGFSLNEICNYPIQSISADMMHLAMLQIYHICKQEKLDATFVLQVHDSLVAEVSYKDAPRVAEIMLNVFNGLRDTFNQYYSYDIGVPLTGEVSMGTSYGSMPYDYDSNTFSIEKIQQDLDLLLNK